MSEQDGLLNATSLKFYCYIYYSGELEDANVPKFLVSHYRRMNLQNGRYLREVTSKLFVFFNIRFEMFISVSFSFSIQYEISEDSFIQFEQSDRSISEVKVWVSCECPMVN